MRSAAFTRFSIRCSFNQARGQQCELLAIDTAIVVAVKLIEQIVGAAVATRTIVVVVVVSLQFWRRTRLIVISIVHVERAVR